MLAAANRSRVTNRQGITAQACDVVGSKGFWLPEELPGGPCKVTLHLVVLVYTVLSYMLGSQEFDSAEARSVARWPWLTPRNTRLPTLLAIACLI